MRIEPRLLGAMAVALALGTTGGAVLGKVPAMHRDGIAELIPGQPQDEEQPDALANQAPDHYALVTREGRFGVSQLSDRGLYRNFRYSPDFAVGAYDQYVAAAEQPVAVEPSGEVIEVSSELAPAEPHSSMEVAEVTPRVIDVAAELAIR